MRLIATVTLRSMRAIISYPAPHRLQGLCWRPKENDIRLAVTTFIAGQYENKIQILQPNSDATQLVCTAEIEHAYPPTKIMWSPRLESELTEYLATSADFLRLWSFTGTSVKYVATIAATPILESCSPLTSFDWNETEPNLVGTCSTDTTCTLWDLNHYTVPKQQIMAHDDEVYDIAFSKNTNVFGSVGADGSLRVFDRRTLQSSNIAYETKEKNALLRLAWNKQDDRFVATFEADSSKVLILDWRKSTEPVCEISGHTASVNSISWSPHSRSLICSAGEDGSAIKYDISSGTGASVVAANGGSTTEFYRSRSPINQIRWSPHLSDCVALCDEDAAHIIQL